MTNHARWLFGIAAAANLLVAASMSLGQRWFVTLLGLDPIHTGTNVVLTDLAAVLIAAFGVRPCADRGRSGGVSAPDCARGLG